MCGRFVLSRLLSEYAEEFSITTILTDPLPASWNVAPTDPIYAIAEHRGERLLGAYRWGLIPHWAKDGRSLHINARMESLVDKPAFRTSLRYRRCLIPADGFYEWTTTESGKQPHYVQRDGGGFAFAGLWAKWTNPESRDEIRSTAIITAPAAPTIEHIHDRMPLHLPPDAWAEWLDREQTDGAAAQALLAAVAAGPPLVHRQVSQRVNSVANNDPDLLT